MGPAKGSSAAQTKDAPSLLQQAEAAARRGHDAQARRLLKILLRQDPTNDRALLWLIYLAEDGQTSLAYLGQLLDAHPRHPQARTAIRWTRRRIPTSVPATPERTAQQTQKRSSFSRRPRRMLYGLVLLTVLIGLGLIWQVSQLPTTSVQAVALPMSPQPLSPSPTAQPFIEIVRVSIPLFTPTADLHAEPTRPSSSRAQDEATTPALTTTATPKSALVPVIGQPQSRNLSCESRSVADLSNYWGLPVDELDFLAALGQSDNPHKGFVGDVDAPPGSLPPYGYGVYAEPIAATLRDYGLNARAVYNLGLDGIRAQLLSERPVMVWATYGMEPHEPLEWTSSDGQVSTVAPFMHTFLVTGFDPEGVFVLDAYDTSVQYYTNEIFLEVWNIFDQMAVVVTGPRTE